MKTLTVKIIVAILAALIVGATVTTIIVLNNQETPPLPPDYNPITEEPNAESMVGTGEKLEAPSGGGAVSLTYSKDVTVNLSDGSVSLMFGNPSKSTQDIVIQLIIGDEIIAQSGLLKPGNKVTRLTLSENVKLKTGEKSAMFLVSFYNAESGERAVLKSEVTGVTVTVK